MCWGCTVRSTEKGQGRPGDQDVGGEMHGIVPCMARGCEGMENDADTES